MNLFEMTGEKYNKNTYFQARKLCLEIVEEIILSLRSGDNEESIQKVIKNKFAFHGVEKFWHPSKFRIASDTLKTFKDLPDQNIKIKSGDLCFIDVGPIINDHEADFGRTFIFEPEKLDPHDLNIKNKLIQANHKVFEQTSQVWKNKKLTGIELYHFAEQQAKELGYELNTGMAGHRLGDFPHHVHTRSSLGEFNQMPVTDLWVLEIHLRDLNHQQGAFFEDVLIN